MRVQGLQRGSLALVERNSPRLQLTAEVASLSDELESRLETMAIDLCERLREAMPSSLASTDLAAQITDLLRNSLRSEIDSFRNGMLPERCPEVDLLAVREVAKSGELKWLLSGSRLCQQVLWEAWFEAVEGSITDSRARIELLRHGSDYFFRYAQLLGDHVTAVYQRELERSTGDGERRRLRAVQALLDDHQPSDSGLDFDLERHHLGLVAWGEDPVSAARGIAKLLGRPLMVVSPLELGRSCWGWLSGTRPLDPLEERRLKLFEPHAARIAFGNELFGLRGFRATHRQAARVRCCATDGGAAILHYQDFVVEALASENDEDARAFVERELRGIDDDSEASRRLRQTLQAYFDSEYNAACAAATLGVHQQTVANRLRAAEERLGHDSIGARHLELELALRLRSCLAPASPQPRP